MSNLTNIRLIDRFNGKVSNDVMSVWFIPPKLVQEYRFLDKTQRRLISRDNSLKRLTFMPMVKFVSFYKM